MILALIGVLFGFFPMSVWLFIVLRLTDRRFEFDYGFGDGTGFSFTRIYRQIHWVIFTPSFILSLGAAGLKWEIPAISLGAAAFWAFLFNLWLTFNQEAYMHARYPLAFHLTLNDRNALNQQNPSPYTRTRYAVSYAMAFSALFAFVLGISTLIIDLLAR